MKKKYVYKLPKGTIITNEYYMWRYKLPKDLYTTAYSDAQARTYFIRKLIDQTGWLWQDITFLLADIEEIGSTDTIKRYKERE